MPNGDAVSEDDFVISYTNDSTGLPEAMPIPKDALRAAISSNPRVFIDSLRDLLERPEIVAPVAGIRPIRPQVEVLPEATSIANMLPEGATAKLSPAAQRLTKGDLLALGGWSDKRVNPGDLGLTGSDIADIRAVFGKRINPGIGRGGGRAGISVSCCCCTPCCCASAELEAIDASA